MTPAPPPARESSLPLVGIILSGVGLIFPPLLIAGLLVGVVALAQKKGSQVQAVLAVLIPLVASTIFGILLVVALPKYRAQVERNTAQRQRGECRANLKGAFTAQRSYFAEKDAFDEHPAKVGFVPERRNRYAYVFAAAGPVPPHVADPALGDVGVGVDPDQGSNAAVMAAIPAHLLAQLGQRGTCPDCAITMLCAANLDRDPALDVWTISTAARPGSAAGELHQESDDLSE